MNQRIKDIVSKHFSFDDETDLQTPSKKKLDTNKIAQSYKDRIEIQENFVDLGLPSGTLWCKHNLGATCEWPPKSWYGDYYAWGKIEKKIVGDNTGVAHDEFAAENISLDKDVAYQANKLTHIPSAQQFSELLVHTTYKYINSYKNQAGLNGFVFTGKNGMSIFMPCNGDINKDGQLSPTTYVELWASTGNPNDNSADFFFVSEVFSPKLGQCKKIFGLGIRPVCDKF